MIFKTVDEMKSIIPCTTPWHSTFTLTASQVDHHWFYYAVTTNTFHVGLGGIELVTCDYCIVIHKHNFFGKKS